MSSANKVGDLFKAAGQAFSQLADMTIQLHTLSEQQPHSSQFKGRLKKKSRNESSSSPPNSDQKRLVKTESPPKQLVYVNQNLIKMNNGQATKRIKSGDVTLSALNATELDIDIEGLGEHHSEQKKLKLEYDSDLD